MRKMCRLFLALLVLCLFAFPAFADDHNLGAGDQAVALDVAWTKTDGESTTNLAGTWFYYTGDNHRTGANLIFVDEGNVSGSGVGPSYDYLFRPMSEDQNWRVVLGGDLSFLTGDFDQVATGIATTRLGIEYTLNGGTAIRLMPRWVTTVDSKDAAMAEQVDSYGITIGFLIGIARDQ